MKNLKLFLLLIAFAPALALSLANAHIMDINIMITPLEIVNSQIEIPDQDLSCETSGRTMEIKTRQFPDTSMTISNGSVSKELIFNELRTVTCEYREAQRVEYIYGGRYKQQGNLSIYSL
jgi:hypothetical protein